jgi:hypothetical protein
MLVRENRTDRLGIRSYLTSWTTLGILITPETSPIASPLAGTSRDLQVSKSKVRY